MRTMENLKKQQKTYQSLNSLYNTDGGKVLVDSLIKDVLNSVEHLANQYKNMDVHEFQAICAEYSAKMALARTLTRAEHNLKVVDEAIEEGLSS